MKTQIDITELFDDLTLSEDESDETIAIALCDLENMLPPEPSPLVGRLLQRFEGKIKKEKRSHRVEYLLRKNSGSKGDITPSFPDPVEGYPGQYLVETILRHRKHGRTWKYLVKWDGFPDSHNEWVLEKNLDPYWYPVYWGNWPQRSNPNPGCT